MELGILRPTAPAHVIEKASSALGESYAYSPGDRHILEFIPPMPQEFWGEIILRYQAGRFLAAEIRRTIKP